MPVSSLDNEFNKYWSLLNPLQKASLLEVIKSFVLSKEKTSIEQYNKELGEALARVEAGEFYTDEEVEKMAKDW
jgi:hypothetical protein